MNLDDTSYGFSNDAYIARQSWRGNMPILVALGAVDLFLLYQAVRDPGPGIVFALAAFCAVTAFLAVLITRWYVAGRCRSRWTRAASTSARPAKVLYES